MDNVKGEEHGDVHPRLFHRNPLERIDPRRISHVVEAPDLAPRYPRRPVAATCAKSGDPRIRVALHQLPDLLLQGHLF